MKRKMMLVASTVLVLVLTLLTTAAACTKSVVEKPIEITLVELDTPTGDFGAADQKFAKAVQEASGGKITFKTYFGGELLGFQQLLTGIGSGVANFGWVHTRAVPELIPAQYLKYSAFSWVPSSVFAGWTGGTESIVLNENEVIAEFKKQNVIPVTGWGNLDLWLASTKPLRTLADFKGQKVYVTGGSWTEAATKLGFVPVTVSPNETEESIQRGMLVGAFNDPSTMGMRNYPDLGIKYLTKIPFGPQVGLAYVINADTYNSLPDPMRKIVIEKIATVLVPDIIKRRVQSADKMVSDPRVTILEPEPAVIKAVREFGNSYVDAAVRDAKAKGNVKDPEKLLSSYTTSINKWMQIEQDFVKDMGPMAKWGDKEWAKVGDRLYKEVYSKLR